MRTLEQVIASLSPTERAKVLARGREIIAEETILQHLRKARKLTQVNMAKQLGVRQDSVSKIERRSDMLISTIRSYIEAMGGKLHLVVEFPDAIAEVTSLGEPDDDDDDTPKRSRPKPRARAQTVIAASTLIRPASQGTAPRYARKLSKKK